MDGSILDTIKKSVGVELSYTGFDTDIILAINTALMSLNQLGIGPTVGFSISDSTSKWSDLLGEATNIEGVKTYLQLRTRLIFDPPSSSFVNESLDRQVKELEWRLAAQVDPPVIPEEEETYE